MKVWSWWMMAVAGAMMGLRPGAPPDDHGAGGAVVERDVALMGTVLSAHVEAADRGTAVAASESAFVEVGRVEGLLSTWRTDTELARLNGAPAGEAVTVSKPLMDLLKRVAELAASTGGAFDPAVGALVDAWDLRGSGRIPGRDELEVALASAGLSRLALDTVRGTATRRAPGVWLDAGGFGKGAALDAAVTSLARAGATRAVLDFGGQVAVFGYDSRPGVVIRVASPEARNTAVAKLRIQRGSVATTSASERKRLVNGTVVGHVLDPRSGRPVAPWGSVTVVARDALTADVLSTALFVMGPEAALAWAEGHGVAVLVLDTEAGGVTARWSAGMAAWLTCVAESVAAATLLPTCNAVDRERRESEPTAARKRP